MAMVHRFYTHVALRRHTIPLPNVQYDHALQKWTSGGIPYKKNLVRLLQAFYSLPPWKGKLRIYC